MELSDRELTAKFARCRILVVGDFDREVSSALLLNDLGAQVIAAGVGGAATKKLLRDRGIDTSAIVRSRRAALEAARERLPAADAVLFCAGDWEKERRELLDAERDEAAADGRALRPMPSPADPRYAFAQSAAQLAAFTLARAAGAAFEDARQFSERYTSGHANQDSRRDTGRRRPQAARKRRKTG